MNETNMGKIKVLHVVEDLKIGGLERIIALIVLGLNRDRYETKVWCLAEGGQIAEQLIDQGVEVKMLGMRSYYNPGQIITLSRLLRSEKIKILHTHGYFGSTFGRLAGIFARIPIVLAHVHSTYYSYKKRNIVTEKFLSLFTDKIICVSEAVKRFVVGIEGIAENKTCLIYNGVEIPGTFEIDSSVNRKSFGFSQENYVAITIASLTPNKGHRVLIDAIKIISPKCKDLRLLIVGDGPLRNNLGEYAEELQLSSKIVFTGQQKDIASLLQLADFLVLPSVEREGLGIALIEAMAAGLPVIGTRLGGIPEVIEENVNGLLFAPGNSEELAAAIEKLIADHAIREKMGPMGRKIYEEKFTAAKMVTNIESLYDELTG
jgi:glycosyltransferase involved in cell wall biosynthesis